MKEKSNSKIIPVKQESDEDKNNNLPGYPTYPVNEDIFNKYKEEKEIDPEDILKVKETTKEVKASKEEDFKDYFSGNDLDVPGSELDDSQEEVGNEDEENNYYSLGGDDHDNLEENLGE